VHQPAGLKASFEIKTRIGLKPADVPAFNEDQVGRERFLRLEAEFAHYPLHVLLVFFLASSGARRRVALALAPPALPCVGAPFFPAQLGVILDQSSQHGIGAVLRGIEAEEVEGFRARQRVDS